jgi:hypothetical protein
MQNIVLRGLPELPWWNLFNYDGWEGGLCYWRGESRCVVRTYNPEKFLVYLKEALAMALLTCRREFRGSFRYLPGFESLLPDG